MRANKRSITLFAGFVCLLFVASCRPLESDAEKGTRLQILHKGNGPEVQDLDPHFVNSVSSLNVISALLEGLVSEDPHDLHPVPGVAESWDISPDQKIYTFHLRHDARWSNGDALSSRKHPCCQFIYTHTFLIRPEVKGWYPTILDHHPYKYVRLE